MALTPKQQKEAVDRVVKLVEEAEPSHADLMRKVDERSKAYHGVVAVNAEAAQWQSQLYPKYAMHIVDTTLASMVEDRLKFKVRPRPTLGAVNDPEKAFVLQAGAEAHQILMDWQNKQTKFTRLQRPFLLQNAIAGITVAKTYWVEDIQRRRSLVQEMENVEDEFGEPMRLSDGTPIQMPVLRERVAATTVYDGPWTEVIDVHDFIWAKNARSIDSSRFVAQKIRITPEDLYEGFKEGGPYGPERGGISLAKLKKTLGETREYADKLGPRWGEKNSYLEEGKIEVLEVYDNLKRDVVVVANRTALIAYKETFPFYHEKAPFVVCTTQPGLFKIPGISQVEKVQALQEMLWLLMNQRVDSVRLLNNAITIFDPHLVEDPDALEFFPGAMWPVGDPRAVQMWQPSPLPAQISLDSEALIKGDMQNVAGSYPFSNATESQTVDQKTATGASIISNLAQRSIDMAKQPVYDAWEDIGNQRMILNGQFIREQTAVPVLGTDDLATIYPELLQGDFDFEITPMPSALAEQEEQAKAQAMVQLIGQIAPILLPLAQAGAARMINMDEVMKYYLHAMGIENPEQFFLQQAPQAQLPQQGGGGQGAGQEDSLGITAGPGGQEPGSQLTDSPVEHMARAMALGGSPQGGAMNG